MKRKQIQLKWRNNLFLISILFVAFCLVNCEDNVDSTAWDPSLPVEFTSFSPDSGGVSTPMFIRGSNFGTDTSLIKVWINGRRAQVINSNGTCIYCFVPARADNGFVEVEIGDAEHGTKYKFEKPFKYTFNTIVSTLIGFTDRDGNSSMIDGTFEKAQFEEPYWLTFDQDGNLLLLEETRAMRKIDLQNETVSTLCKVGGGWDRPRTMSFNPNYDTLYVTNDQGNWDGIAVVTFVPSTGFTEWKTLIKSKQCNGGAAHPQTGDFFFNSFEHGQLYKWNRSTQTQEELGVYGDVEWEYNVQFAPSGDFAYLVNVKRCYVAKAMYNREKNILETPTDFVGKRSEIGYADGVGTAARFNEPHQGAFDENDNFYLCDRMNHCIRKITPEGVVTTFAGRPIGKEPKWGYADGPLREAQFDRPHGIVYDRKNGVFYIADQKNRRIRTIRVE